MKTKRFILWAMIYFAALMPVLPAFAELSNFPNGVTSFGIPQYGSGGAIPDSTGTYFWVSSEIGIGSNSNDGKSPETPFATIDYAIGKCTASKGDVIVVMPGHAETITAAGGIDIDVAGITIVGLGVKDQRPTITATTSTSASITVDAADCTLSNVIIDVNIDRALRPLDINADDFTFKDSDFLMADSTYQTYTAVDIGVVTGTTIDNIRFSGHSQTDQICAIGFHYDALGTNAKTTIKNCRIQGDFSTAAISGGGTPQVDIINCYVWNYRNAAYAIKFPGAATGSIRNCHVVTDAIATAVDPGTTGTALDVFETYWTDDGHASDTMGVQIFVNDAGVATWSATELAAIQSEANDALVQQNLDHVVQATSNLVSDVDSDSVVGNIVSIAATTNFNRATDSLEAVGDQVADTNLQEEANDALIQQNLDHVAQGTSNLVSDVDSDSIVGNIVSIAATTNFDRTTDSLQAIGDQVADANLQEEAEDALEFYTIDHLAAVNVGTDLPTAVTDSSILGNLFSASAMSGFSRTRDSLEAISKRLLNFAAATTKDTHTAATSSWFTVTGGPIKVLGLVGTWTTAQSAAACNMRLAFNPSGDGATTNLCAATSISSLGLGSWVSLPGIESMGLSLDIPATSMPTMLVTPTVYPPGTLDVTIDASVTAGASTFYLQYEPLVSGATVTGS